MIEYIISENDIDKSTKDATKLLSKILKKAKGANEEVLIKFQKGEYHFYKDFAESAVCYTSNTDADRFPRKSIAINIDGHKNLTVDGGNSLFVMHGDMMALAVRNSENIKFLNFSWDFPCPTVFEMHAVAGGMFHTDYFIPEKSEYEFTKNKLNWHEKSPISGEKYWQHVNHCEQWLLVGLDKESGKAMRYPLTQGPMFMIRKIKRLKDGNLRIYYYKPTPKIQKPGTVFEMCPNKNRDCCGAFIEESKNISFENVNVHYMHGFGFLVQMSENVSFESCRFEPRKGTNRHTASFADIIHVSGAKGFIKIQNCNLCNAHDDAINIHGTYTRVKDMINNNTLVLEYVHPQQNGFCQYHKGDKVIFWQRDTLEGAQNEKEFTVKSVENPLEGKNSIKEMKVTFEEELPAFLNDSLAGEKKYVAENVTYTPEVIIKNNTISHIPTRGILCTTRKK